MKKIKSRLKKIISSGVEGWIWIDMGLFLLDFEFSVFINFIILVYYREKSEIIFIYFLKKFNGVLGEIWICMRLFLLFL